MKIAISSSLSSKVLWQEQGSLADSTCSHWKLNGIIGSIHIFVDMDDGDTG